MARWVALIRGMNIGGKRLSVGEMRAAGEGLGWTGVRSYLASGNLVFEAEGSSEALAGDLRRALAAKGLDVPVLVLSAEALAQALAGCPFAPAEGKHVHAVFLWQPPTLDGARIAALQAPSEELVLEGLVAWLHTPEGFGTSKLAERLGQAIRGTEMTARNLNTVRALAAMVDEARDP